MSILLNEIFKLLTHAGAKDVTIFRLGSSGGLGIKPGTVVVTTEAVNGEIKPVYEQVGSHINHQICSFCLMSTENYH